MRIASAARLSRALPAAAAAFPVRLYRRRFLRRGDAAAEMSRIWTVALRQRVLRDVSTIDLSTTCSVSKSMPVASGRSASPDERPARRSAGGAGGRGSGRAVLPLDRLGLRRSTKWRRRTRRADLVPALHDPRPRLHAPNCSRVAKAAGCTALVFTVDMPVPGSRYRDERSGLRGPGSRGRCGASARR